MARGIFHPDSALMITMTQITDCIFLSLFWLLGCFPVITVGTSFAALYDAVYYGFRKGDKHSWQRFLHSYRQNLKSGLVPSVLFLAGAALVLWAGIQLWNSAVYGKISWMVFAAAAFLMLQLVGIGSILFPMLSRFENSLSGLLKNTVLLAMANPHRTLALGLMSAVTIYLCTVYIIPLCFLPGLTALLSTLFIEPMFKPYMPEEDAA